MARAERFVAPPHAAYVPRDKRHITMMDRQLAALRRRDEEMAARITTEAEVIDELTNFTLPVEVDEYGLPLRTPYMVEDAVPNLPVPAPETETQKTNPDSVRTPDSDSNPAAGTE